MSDIPDMVSLQRFGPGNLNCGGCGMGVAMRIALEELGADTILAIPACCAAVSVGSFPNAAVRVPTLLHAFETTGATLAGIRAALEVRGESRVNVVGWAGDGGTYDIGLQALSGAAERNEDVIYVCYDNEAYMNTGVQRSSATPAGAWTTTTPTGKTFAHPKKDIVGIVAAHSVPYIATCSVAYPDDLREKIRRAKETTGFRFLLVQSPCPTGWRSDSKDSIRIARLGVECGLFPLLEVFGGRRWRINREPTFAGLEEYLALQGRFSALTGEQKSAAGDDVEKTWQRLRRSVHETAAGPEEDLHGE